MTGKPLNRQEKIFVARYIVDFNAYQSAKDAGYAESTALKNAAMWVCEDRDKSIKPHVWDAVQEAIAARMERIELTQDWVVDKLRNLAEANIMDYITVDENGLAIVNLKGMSRDQAAALRGVKVKQITEDGKRVGEEVDLRLSDPKPALELLGKHVGMWPSKHEHSGPGGGPIPIRDHTPRELARRICFVLNRGLQEAEAAEQG